MLDKELLTTLEPFFIPREVPIFLLRSFLESIYKIEITGLENIPNKGGAVLVCNHTDNLDPFIQGVYIPRTIVFLGKHELFAPHEPIIKLLNADLPIKNIPGFNFLKTNLENALTAAADLYKEQLKKWGSLPVIRGYQGQDAKSAVAYYDALENFMVNLLKEGNILSIYPEGTRTTSGVMAPFKALAAKIAIRAGVPIIPSGISGAWKMSEPQAFISGQAFGATIKYNVGIPMTPDTFPEEKNEKKAAKILTEDLEKRVYFLTNNEERRGTPRRFATKL